MRTRRLKAPEQLNSGHQGHTQKPTERDFRGGPGLRICLAMQGTWVRSLVRELRFHMWWRH